jgi:hypothetical protein
MLIPIDRRKACMGIWGSHYMCRVESGDGMGWDGMGTIGGVQFFLFFSSLLFPVYQKSRRARLKLIQPMAVTGPVPGPQPSETSLLGE